MKTQPAATGQLTVTAQSRHGAAHCWAAPVRLLATFLFCFVLNELAARANITNAEARQDYLNLVHLGNFQILIFYCLAWGIQKMFWRPNS